MMNFYRTAGYSDGLVAELLRHSVPAWPSGPSDRYPVFAIRQADPNRVGLMLLLAESQSGIPAGSPFGPRAVVPAFAQPQWRAGEASASRREPLTAEVFYRDGNGAEVIEEPQFAVPLRRAHPLRGTSSRRFTEPAYQDAETTPARPLHATTRSRSDVGLRCLLPKPGVKRTVRFGDFKGQLAPQLAHPERLREAHRLPCCVQLYELTCTQTLGSVAHRVLGVAADACQLISLTETVARRLQLPIPARPTGQAHSEPGDEAQVLAAGERIARLRVLVDHTRDTRALGEPRETADERAAGERQRAAEPATVKGRDSIPERFLKPWDFRLTREEALFDMAVEASAARGITGRLLRALRALATRSEHRRWCALLEGKSADEQLWCVRPPSGRLTDATIRDWAGRTLALAGYDAGTMLREWELYWRRKGV